MLGEVTGGGGYDDLLAHTQIVEVFNRPVRCVTLERLIQLKRAAGRPKDLEAIAELVALLEDLARGAPFASAFHQRLAMRYEDFAAVVARD